MLCTRKVFTHPRGAILFTLVGQTIALCGLPPSGSVGRRHKTIVFPNRNIIKCLAHLHHGGTGLCRQSAPIRLTDSPPPASPSPHPAAQVPRTACAGRSSARPPTRR